MAAPGIVTSGTGPPNAVVQVQPGMQVQPVVLVDANGNYVTTSGSTATAGYLADLTGSVNVSQAAAPTTGQVLTATSGTTATWQSGSTETAGYLATQTTSVYVAGGSAPTTGMELIATSGSAATWQFGANGILTTLGDMLFENSTPALARLAGNTTTTRKFLTQTGNGTVSANPAWGTLATGDLPVPLPLPVIDGGTGGSTATAGFNNLSPMTTLGDMIYGGTSGTGTRLAGGTTATTMVLTQTGGGTASTAPAWAVQNYAGVFGTGTDGAVTLDGSTTYNGFSSLAGSVYTLTRDVQASSLTINNGVTLKTANYRVFCTGTITNNGTISNVGNNASGGTGGGVSSGASLGGGRGGGAGGTGVSGTGGNGTAASAGSAGGNGGAGTSGAAGSGASPTGPSAANAGNNPLALPFAALTSILIFGTFQGILQFGCGGGGGGSDLASNAGGGGGGGGSVIVLFAAAVVNNGTITAAGGNGAAGTGGNAGGGGGGAGGAILVYTLTAWTAGTTSAAGGTAGSGSGTGSGGSNGGNGLVLNSVLK
jgi:hypothetical protein